MRLTPSASRLIRSARVAHLATADSSGQPHVIPICFVFDGKSFYFAIDEKPKRTTKLKRLKNIAENPNVAFVIDTYDEDWRKLGYILVFATARITNAGKTHGAAIKLLRRKYHQYRAMALEKNPIVALQPKRFVAWSSEPRQKTSVDIKGHIR